jgi:hypothetical protein
MVVEDRPYHKLALFLRENRAKDGYGDLSTTNPNHDVNFGSGIAFLS